MFTPQVDSTLTVELPQEVCRAMVMAVPDEDTVIVELTGATVSKSHAWKQGDLVTCRRARGMLGEVWRAIDPAQEQRMRMMEQINAANARKVKGNGKSQHLGNGGERAQPGSGGGSSPEQRKAASKNG